MTIVRLADHRVARIAAQLVELERQLAALRGDAISRAPARRAALQRATARRDDLLDELVRAGRALEPESPLHFAIHGVIAAIEGSPEYASALGSLSQVASPGR